MAPRRLTNEEFLNRVNEKWENEWRLITDEDIEKVNNGEIQYENSKILYKDYTGSLEPISLLHKPCNRVITKTQSGAFSRVCCPYCVRFDSEKKGKRIKKAKETNLKRYGVENVSQVKEFKEKRTATILKKFGVENAMQSSEIVDKMKKTIKNNYGVENAMFLKEVRDKMKQARSPALTKEQIQFRDKNTIKEAILTLTKVLGKKPTIDEIVIASGLAGATTLYHQYDLGKYSELYQSLSGESKAEIEIVNFLSQYVPIEQHNRLLLKGQELDIYIPEFSIAIEYAGMYWHGSSPHSAKSNPKPKDYHFNKYQQCLEQGIHLITLYESEWESNSELIKKKLLQYIGVNNSERIHARKCEVKEIKTPKIAAEFLNQFHTQGKANASFRCGAYYNNQLVAVMQFGKNFRSSDNGIELNRFATDTNYRIPGIFTKMLKWSIKKWSIERLYSYADHRWVSLTSNVYLNNGWTVETIGKPDYCYYNAKEKVLYHKSHYQKKSIAKLLPDYYDSSKTEFEMMDQVNYIHRIYDCGKTKYVLNIERNDADELS